LAAATACNSQALKYTAHTNWRDDSNSKDSSSGGSSGGGGGGDSSGGGSFYTVYQVPPKLREKI